MLNNFVNSSYYLMMGKIIHRVDKNETLKTLSKRYGVPSYIIAKENNIKEIGVGMRVIIPDIRGIKHIVKPFETLEAIAREYNVTISKIQKNNYNINEVFLGQIIYIPYRD